jgi:hypothetical protein
MQAGGALALTAIIVAAGASILIGQRRGAGWRRIVVVALLVWLGVAALVVLWALIAAVAGQGAYFGAIQVPLSALTEATVGIAFAAVAMHGVSPGLRQAPSVASLAGSLTVGVRQSRPAASAPSVRCGEGR